jgi:hypothetical protein
VEARGQTSTKSNSFLALLGPANRELREDNSDAMVPVLRPGALGICYDSDQLASPPPAPPCRFNLRTYWVCVMIAYVSERICNMFLN